MTIENPGCHKELQLMHRPDLNGKKVQKMHGDSFCCTVENNATL